VDAMRLTSRGCSQVCVKVESEDQLLEMAAAATARGLVTSVIEDAGRTQVPRAHSSPILLASQPLGLSGSMFPFWCHVPILVRTNAQTYREHITRVHGHARDDLIDWLRVY
jgi:hypothetical protein